MPVRQAYFGDLHVHTAFSFEFPSSGVRATPDDAYRYARGEAIEHPLGYPLRLRERALDFLAVSDHAEYLGVARALADPEHRSPAIRWPRTCRAAIRRDVPWPRSPWSRSSSPASRSPASMLPT